MKKILLIILSAISLNVRAQITINTSDMPSVGDTFRISNGLITPTIDPAPTGSATTWDFSMLQWVTQDVDSFVGVGSTGAIYSLVFINVPFNPYRANLVELGPVLPSIPQLTVTDVYDFLYNTSGSYEQSGLGASINGFQTPIPFDNKDRIYDFPVDFGNIDSSDSDFQISLPGLGFLGHQQRRVNECDGWGTLITPYGTFNTIRIKSIITSNDSVFVDSLGIGFPFPTTTATEYKWLGQSQGIPLLQINTTTNLGVETVTAIIYQDSVRSQPTAVPQIETETTGFSVYPNPTTKSLSVKMNSVSSGSLKLYLYDPSGRRISELFNGNIYAGENLLGISIDDLSTGVYILEAVTAEKNLMQRLVILR